MGMGGHYWAVLYLAKGDKGALAYGIGCCDWVTQALLISDRGKSTLLRLVGVTTSNRVCKCGDLNTVLSVRINAD